MTDSTHQPKAQEKEENKAVSTDETKMAKVYEFHDVESRWYAFWEQNGFFHPDADPKMHQTEENAPAKTFSIVIPPPNVTGVLHMGHALNNTLQDILCRYKRLRGEKVLWMPGTDHAGIATQNVVERKLAEEGKDRNQLGREKFIEEVWKWRKEYGGAIINQLKRLGASCDWERERFTMDEGLSKAVLKVFVDLYRQGLIYRGTYIINWCHRCHTALSDLEVEHEEKEGNLYYIRYPFSGSGEGIVVATTRPETMLGDSGLAIHPEDERYLDLSHEFVILPLMNREIPIVRDPYVDMSFGSGGLKVTPAHDPNDYEIGKRHNLAQIRVIDDDGNMTPEAGKYAGMDRFACREAVVEDLKKEGLLIRVEPITHSVGHCYRCNTVVEPNLSMQWFVKTKPLAEKAIEAVETGKTRIIPEMWKNTYFDWMYNIRDWCISRQIWWGHRIPAWYCRDCGEATVETEAPEECCFCGSKSLIQEEDVLDTWFSSALWPFSTLGWPDETRLLKNYYPTSVLVTAFDILFFWVARMMMMGIHFMEDVPFHDVYVHALIRDEDGQKMSKSKGNVIDPLTVIDTYGTDAFRFTLAAFAAQGRDIKMSEKRVEGYRHFVNKLWNAARFSMMHIDKGYPDIPENDLSLPDQWILSRLSTITREAAEAIEEYRFNEAAGAIYQFLWHEFCDWYLEAVKPVLYGDYGREKQLAAKSTLWRVLKDSLLLLHPFMPFVTEEIWEKLPGTQGSIMDAVFPLDSSGEKAPVSRPDAETRMAAVISVISGIRNIRGEMNIPPSLKLEAVLYSENPAIRNTLAEYQDLVVHLAGLSSFSVTQNEERPKSAATAIVADAAVYVLLEGVIDFEKEIVRLEKELTKVTKELSTVHKKLTNEDFLNKAPEEVVNKAKGKQNEYMERKEKLESNIARIREMEVQ